VAFRKSIRPIFNYFEKIWIGIKAEAYEGNILKDAFFDLFTNYYTMFLPLIKDNRVGARTMRHAYLEFEILSKSWNQPKQQN
jgi:hypothetical protein